MEKDADIPSNGGAVVEYDLVGDVIWVSTLLRIHQVNFPLTNTLLYS